MDTSVESRPIVAEQQDGGLVERLREEAEFVETQPDYVGSPDATARVIREAATAISERDRRIAELEDARAEQDAEWETTTNVLCERLGIERKADAHHIVTAINALRAECEGLRAALSNALAAGLPDIVADAARAALSQKETGDAA